MSSDDPALIGLWLAVAASGLYHGVNPGMGWPLAVSAGLMERKASALFSSLLPLAFGHFAAMMAVVLPFALLTTLVLWQREIRIGASLLVIAFGLVRLFNQRHPRVLARIRPAQLALWSFAIAMAHGAGLMLVPIYLGLHDKASGLHGGHGPAGALMGNSLTMAILVSLLHTAAMICAGGVAAWLVYRYLGLEYLSKSWFNLDTVWAASLILVGGIGFVAAL